MSRNHFVFAVLAGVAAWFATCFFHSPHSAPEVVGWERPVYADGFWRLSGIAEEMIQREMFGVKVDLLRVRYRQGELWAAAGAQRSDGLYESFVDGVSSRDQVCDAFVYPRWVTLRVSGAPGQAGTADCPDQSSPRCHITRLAERATPLLLAGDSEYTDSASTIFVRTGVFPGHYLYGFLTWDIAPGQVIEPGMEGY